MRFRGLLLLAAIGCGGPKPPQPVPVAPPPTSVPQATADEEFRRHAPKPEGSVSFTAPTIDKRQLKGGVPVYLAKRSDLELISVQLVIRGGAQDFSTPTGLATLLDRTWELGTKRKDAVTLSDAFDELAAHHGTWIGWSSSGLAVTVPTAQLAPALALLAEVALEPSFPAEELERVRSRRLAQLQEERTNPSSIFSNVAATAVFGRKHPYGQPLGGLEADLKKISRAQLQRAYRSLLDSNRLAVVVAGKFDEAELLPLLETHFGKRKANASLPAPPNEPTLASRAIALVDKPGAQSQIGVVGLGIDAKANDRVAASVMNAILGGAFSSRVNLNLREKHAYTYGARSWFELRRGTGPFTVRASVVADKTIEAIGELLSEVARMRSTDVSPEELRMAKDYLKLTLPARFETVEDLARAATDLFVFDYPDDELATRAERIEAVTVADVRKAAERLLDTSRWRLLVVGDGALQPALEKLQIDGTNVKVERYDEVGAPL